MGNNAQHRRYEVGDWKQDEIKSWWAHIYVGGDYCIAENICRELCFPQGLCVTVEPIRYVFGGGTEDGVRIGMIQYPPFPEDESILTQKAIRVGREVAEANHQWSFTVVTPNQNIYLSRRK